MTNQEKEIIMLHREETINDALKVTLKDSLVEFCDSREEYIGTKIITSEKYKITYALYDGKYLALKESIKENTEANSLLFELLDITGELGLIDTEMYYRQGLNDGLNLINSIREL